MPVISDDQLYSILKENDYASEKQLQTAKKIATDEKVSLYGSRG